LTPSADCQEIQVKHFINELEQQRHNLPQQVLCRWSDDTPFTLTQLNGEVAEKSSSPCKPARGWVWHSTDASIAAGQISVLSVLETFCALGLYGWLAFHFQHQWWLLISAVAAPIILLRSPESKALGLDLAKSYWNSDDILRIKKPSISTTFMSFNTSFQIIYWLGNWGVFGEQQWELFFRSLILAYLSVSIMPGIGAATGAILAFLMLNSLNIKVGVEGVLVGLTIGSFSSFQLKIWLESVFIRIYSSVRHVLSGFRQIPFNWHKNLLSVDVLHTPELLPGSGQISQILSVNGLIELIYESKGKAEKFMLINTIIIWYIPSLLWRWSLKATLWLWFPLALLLRSPFEGKSLGEVRDIAAIRINGLGKWLPLLAVVVMLWLSSGYFSPQDIQSWAELGGDTISKLLDKLLAIAPPPPGLRHWALWLACGLSIIMWWLSDRLQIMHKKVLEEDALDGLTKERRNLFLQRAHRLERWHTARVVSFILLGYSFALYLANEWYPLELGRFVPAWLLGWL
jgi:hypothetical protein